MPLHPLERPHPLSQFGTQGGVHGHVLPQPSGSSGSPHTGIIEEHLGMHPLLTQIVFTHVSVVAHVHMPLHPLERPHPLSQFGTQGGVHGHVLPQPSGTSGSPHTEIIEEHLGMHPPPFCCIVTTTAMLNKHTMSIIKIKNTDAFIVLTFNFI